MRLTPRDMLIFEELQRHGPLPQHYLYALTKRLGSDPAGFRKRVLHLYRESYLIRVDTLSDPNSFTYFKVYNLAPKAEKMLGAKHYHYAPAIKEGNEHALMTAYITANIELEAAKRGYRYISQEEILERAPEATRKAKEPLVIPSEISWRNSHSKRPTEPDQLFGIDYGDNNCRFFALETDRATEPLQRDNLNQNSILRKQLCYQDILKRRRYIDHFGIPHLFPLFITTSRTRATNMKEQLKELYPNGSKFFLHGFMDGFDPYFFPPRGFYPALFGEYARMGEPLDISKP